MIPKRNKLGNMHDINVGLLYSLIILVDDYKIDIDDYLGY